MHDKLTVILVTMLVLVSGGSAFGVGAPADSTPPTNPNHQLSGTDMDVHAPASCANVLPSPPASVEDGQLESVDNNVTVFHERNTTLPQDMEVDINQSATVDSWGDAIAGALYENTTVDSYLIHYDTVSPSQSVNCTVSFDDDVLAVLIRDRTLDESDSFLGAPATTYPADSLAQRGLDIPPDEIVVDMATDTVTVDLVGGSTLDHVRVITGNESKPVDEEPDEPRPNETEDGGTRLLTEEVVTKTVHLSAGVSNLTVLRTPPQTTFLKETSCLVQDSDAWAADGQARLAITVGNETVVRCSGAQPTFGSTQPMTELAPGTEIRITTNDGGVYELDLWLQIRVNRSTMNRG